MFFTWSAECGADDPVLVVPWSAPPDPGDLSATSHFVDLREDPYAVDEIAEGEAHPPLLQALRALNAARSPLFTAKCDVWSADGEELEALRDDLSVPPELAGAGTFSYIDLLWRDRSIFTSFHQHEHLVDRLARRAEPLDHPLAVLDCVIRPALVDLAGPQEGFALTLYVKAAGPDTPSANATWSSTLQSAVALLRSRDLTPNT